jgi:hypothetical protein
VDWILLVVYRWCGERESWEGGVICGWISAVCLEVSGGRDLCDGGVDCGLDKAACVEVQCRKGNVGGWRILLFGFCWLYRGTIEKETGGRVPYMVDWNFWLCIGRL